MIEFHNPEIQKYFTPFKYPVPLISGSGKKENFDSKGVDIPFVFQHMDSYYMVYSGFDGTGYQSALAVSRDLVRWNFLSLILKREPQSSRWDKNGGAVTWMLKENDNLWEIPRLGKAAGKYWLVYHSYPGTGYEAGPAEIGLAWCDREDLLEWHRLDAPVLSWKDGAAWESHGLYKACMLRWENKWYLFYNAKNQRENWNEQIGVAVSEDMFHWKRYEGNPILRNSENGWDKTFVADPYVVRDGEKWLCFYYGIGRLDEEDGLYHAEDGLAVSKDLLHWEKVEKPILSHGKKGDFDHHHAHKPAMFFDGKILYHFYCGTCEAAPEFPTQLFGEYRTICMASNRRL